MISSAKIAKLANLTLTNPADFDSKLEETIRYIDILKEIDTKDIVPTAQVEGKICHLREDVVEKTRIIPAVAYKSKISWTN